jgi:mannosyltransferase OCH1-like enzyme
MEQHQLVHLAIHFSLNPVKRSDLWSYLVILNFGGIYTDADTICKTVTRRPLASMAIT